MTDQTDYPWHDAAWRRLAGARAAGRLPHALLLTGPTGLGKSAFARRLSAALVCPTPTPGGDACRACAACRQSGAGSHPDQRHIRPEAAGKMIKIDAIRELGEKTVLAPQQGGYRVFVIDPAEAMNRAAANALLKTLEEPGPRALLILVSSYPERLAATIRSRCQVVPFGVPPVAEVEAWLQRHGPGADVAELLAISGGAPLRALRAREEGWPDLDRRLAGELTALKARDTNPIGVVEEWENRSITQLVAGLKRLLSDLIRLAVGLDRAALYHPGLRGQLQSLGRDIDLRRLYEFNDDLLRIDRNSANNLNVQMMFEQLVNHWLQITRPGRS